VVFGRNKMVQLNETSSSKTCNAPGSVANQGILDFLYRNICEIKPWPVDLTDAVVVSTGDERADDYCRQRSF
jgi:hypothetical protein